MILIYYTALVLGYTLDGEMLTTTFWVKSYDQCIEAMDQLEHMYDFLADHVATDNRMYMWCEETSVPSNEQDILRTMPVKPRMRPNS